MSEDFITMTIGKQKNIALIAHDNKKADLIDWCEQNKEILKQHFLCGTGTTARMITDQTGLPVRGYNSGPLGGDQQIGAATFFFFNGCFGFLSDMIIRFLSLCHPYPSIAMYFFCSTAGFASFFGTTSVKIPCLNSALISSSVTPSPT